MRSGEKGHFRSGAPRFKRTVAAILLALVANAAAGAAQEPPPPPVAPMPQVLRDYQPMTAERLLRPDSGILAPPTSFLIDGKQYIAVESGWGGDSRGMQATLNRLFPGEFPEVPEAVPSGYSRSLSGSRTTFCLFLLPSYLYLSWKSTSLTARTSFSATIMRCRPRATSRAVRLQPYAVSSARFSPWSARAPLTSRSQPIM